MKKLLSLFDSKCKHFQSGKSWIWHLQNLDYFIQGLMGSFFLYLNEFVIAWCQCLHSSSMTMINSESQDANLYAWGADMKFPSHSCSEFNDLHIIFLLTRPLDVVTGLTSCFAYRSLFDIGNKDVVFQASPLTFDPSVVEIFCALSSGACLLVVPEAMKHKGNQLADCLMDNAVTVLQVGIHFILAIQIIETQFILAIR